MKEAAAKYGIKLSLIAANSPWSNGKNERNHYSVENPNIKLFLKQFMPTISKLSRQDLVQDSWYLEAKELRQELQMEHQQA